MTLRGQALGGLRNGDHGGGKGTLVVGLGLEHRVPGTTVLWTTLETSVEIFYLKGKKKAIGLTLLHIC